ncbi:MAG: NAD+ synthase [Acidimicrobiia bacterium]|nr:NAD+ synthase [Acidimicrobiia bacterium]
MALVRVALCQVNAVVGDLDGNVQRVLSSLRDAEAAGCDLAVYPELVLTGYPPEDLLLKPGFVEDCRSALDRVVEEASACAAVVGTVDARRDLHNAAAVVAGGRLVSTYHKRLLPNYSVFDEQRYFVPGSERPELIEVAGVRAGVSVCEDAWDPAGAIAVEAAGGAELIVNINASPYYAGRALERERLLGVRASDASCPVVYVNLVGGQDELVFDGGSFVVDADGRVVARAPQFEEATLVVDIEVAPVYRKRLLDPRGRAQSEPLPVQPLSSSSRRPPDEAALHADLATPLEPVTEVYEALVLGTRDYVRKNGFGDVVIALSGGIDSSLVAAVAVDAVGPERVHGVSMPSRFSSEGSRTDAEALGDRLGLELRTIPIEPAHDAFLDMLRPVLGERPPNLTEENLQSRIRGVVVMALSNELDWLVLTTGNKSEVAVGYSTLYGDTAGGFAVLKDVPKTLVYALCRERNRRAGADVIPEAVLTKPPSAELRPDQRDDESLPPYEVLDPLLAAYVEDDRTRGELERAGCDPELVRRVTALVDRAEYKRRQSPPGVRVSRKAFGKDRRLPITSRYPG